MWNADDAQRSGRAERYGCQLARVIGLVGVILTLAVDASAQAAAADPPLGFRRWDVNAGIGMQLLNTREIGESFTYWDQWPQPRLQVGFYLTRHLKVEFAVTTPHDYDFYEDERIPVPGLPQGGFAYTRHAVQSFTLRPVFTYQFRENAFVHPFVSAGVNGSFLDEQRTRSPEARRVNGVSYTVPALSARRTDVLVRPVVSAGCKAYFNERTFVRPEVGLGFGPNGLTQVSLQFDFGLDF